MPEPHYDSLKEALKKWEYYNFTLCGARQQGGYVEVEAQHPNHNNIRSRARTLEQALEGLKRQIDTQFRNQ